MTGATGFVGGRLADELAGAAIEARCLVRDAGRVGRLRAAGHELHEGDVLDPSSLAGAGEGIDVAYYLIHSMGRGGDDGFAERERRAARNFARMAREEGVAGSSTSAASATAAAPSTSAAATRPRRS